MAIEFAPVKGRAVPCVWGGGAGGRGGGSREKGGGLGLGGRGGQSWPNIYPDLKILSVFLGSQYFYLQNILKYMYVHLMQSILALFVIFILLLVYIANTCIKKNIKNSECCRLSE